MTQAATQPTWLQRVLGRVPLERAQPQPIPFHAELRHIGMGPTNQPQADTLLRESLGWSALATKAIADRIASIELVAFRVDRDGEDEQIERSHPLSRILRGGSSLHGPIQTQRLIAQYLVTLGEAYLLKVRATDLVGVPVQIWVMHAARVAGRGALRAGPHLARRHVPSARRRAMSLGAEQRDAVAEPARRARMAVH